MDQVGDRFRLHEVNASVDKCALRKFAGLGETGPGIQCGAQYAARALPPAMSLYFYDIFHRITVGCTHDEQKCLIYKLFIINHMPNDKCACRPFRRFGVAAAEDPVGDAERVRPRYAHDGNPALAGRGGYGCYGVGGIQGPVFSVRCSVFSLLNPSYSSSKIENRKSKIARCGLCGGDSFEQEAAETGAAGAGLCSQAGPFALLYKFFCGCLIGTDRVRS